jgi:hypothetical protein
VAHAKNNGIIKIVYEADAYTIVIIVYADGFMSGYSANKISRWNDYASAFIFGPNKGGSRSKATRSPPPIDYTLLFLSLCASSR